MSNLNSKRSSQLVLLTRLQATVDGLALDSLTKEELEPYSKTLNDITKTHKIIISALEDEPDANFEKITDDVEQFNKVTMAIQARLLSHQKEIGAAGSQANNFQDGNEDQRSVSSGRSFHEGPTNATRIVCLTKMKLIESELSSNERMMDGENPHSLFRLRSMLSSIEPLREKRSALMYTISESGIDEEELNLQCTSHQDFIQRYFDLEEKIRRRIDEIESQAVKASSEVYSPRVKLPSIDLPKFNGSPEDWISFRDTFKSLVHCNPNLTGSTKFRYLKTSITDRLSPIAHLPESDAGYEDAWNSVMKCYDDERKIIDKHFTCMFAAKRMNNESFDEIQRIINEFSNHTSSLERLYSKAELFDMIIANLVIYRLDSHTRDLWESDKKDDIPKWPELCQFLEKRRKVLSTLPVQKSQPKTEPSRNICAPNKQSFYKSANTYVANKQFKPPKCLLCSGEHYLNQCSTFAALTVKQKFSKINEWKICENCLGRHPTNECKSKKGCKTCNGNHHTSLHDDKAPSHTGTIPKQHNNSNGHQASSFTIQTDPCASEFFPLSKRTTCNSSRTNSTVLLSTAIVKLQDRYGRQHEVRALLDSGSDDNYITKNVADLLRLPMESVHVEASGLGQKKTVINRSVTVKVSSMNGNHHDVMNLLVTKQITGPIPNNRVPRDCLNIPIDMSLADPSFNIPGRIDMLIGNEFYWDLMLQNIVKLDVGLTLKETVYGWIVAGKFSTSAPVQTRNCNLVSRCELKEVFEKFYKDEDYRNEKGFPTDEEEFCERTFEQTHERAPDGRFIIKIPLKENVSELVCNRNQAMCQFIANEKRLKSNERLQNEYVKFMREYEQLGHMKEVDTRLDDDSTKYYMPHHAVENPSSTTTKVRIVFNASSKTKSGLSFNDVQCIGPKIQSDSFQLTLKFRQYPIIIKADIEKMYRNIEVHPSQRRFQRILWREQPSGPIKTYELNTVTYGTASASFQSTRCLKQLAIENRLKFPKAAEEIEKGFYVDDLISGASTSDDAIKLFTEIDSIIRSGKMKLRKISSNNADFLERIPENDKEVNEADKTISSLGIKWNPIQDQISFDVKPMVTTNLTKRIVLSEYAKIYDPEGLLGPVIFRFKRFMTTIHQLQINWDEKLPEDKLNEWIELTNNITILNSIRINRHVMLSNPVSVQLHGFSDASNLGYGAAIYVRSEDSLGNVMSHLLCAKSRVAPTQLLSIPRLELCGAKILAYLMKYVKQTFSITFDASFCWVDSAIVLHWLKKSPSVLQRYVAARVSEIQSTSDGIKWRHIRGEDNPADLISRGSSSDEIVNNKRWWHGPEFLLDAEESWPSSIVSIDPDEASYASEFKKVHMLAITNQNEAPKNSILMMVETFSSLSTVKRKLAPVMRFIYNVRASKAQQPRRKGQFSVDDYNDVEIAISRAYQKEGFKAEFQQLRDGKQVNSKSNLKNLNPFWDGKANLIRVGGRLNHASHFNDDQKHQILLPKCHLTTLIIRDLHHRYLHSGQQATHGFLKMKFWPLRAKDLIRHQLHKCITCFRAKPRLMKQFMGQLPQPRVTQAPTFFNTGVDYAGPVNIKTGYTKAAKTMKCYIALFVCLSTKALHLEIVSDLTTEAFLAAMDRFASRRGLPGHMYSDNGRNFVGASNQLKELYTFLRKPETQDTLQKHLSKNEVTWHFIPPRAPEQGGLWEAGVKSMKHHLIRVTQDASLHYEELQTVICKIEAILNSRPLIPISNDPNDLQPLTAGHFLIGRPLNSMPQQDLIDIPMSRLRRWDRVMQMMQHFWKRWHQEYLHQLQVRTKNFTNETPIRVGQVVLVKQEAGIPLEWPIGRIIEIMPGKDSITRVVRVQTNTGRYVRPLTELAMLPIEDNEVPVGAGVC